MTFKSLFRFAVVSTTMFFTLTQTVFADGHENGQLLKDIPSGKYALDLTHASVVWKVSHFGFSTYVGRFTDFSADIDLDSENFSNSSVMVDIKTSSIDTAYPSPEEKDFDKILSKDWLKSGKAPSITFKSTEVSDLNGHNFIIKGEMTMAGKTHPVTLNAKLNGATPKHPFKKKPLIGFSASTTIDRTTWGVSKYVPKIGAEVAVEIEGEFIKAD